MRAILVLWVYILVMVVLKLVSTKVIESSPWIPGFLRAFPWSGFLGQGDSPRATSMVVSARLPSAA